MPARFALLCLVALLFLHRSSAQQYDLRKYSLEQGMPGANVNALCEDRHGYLWIGTNDGVTRTDGIHFENLGMENGLVNDDVTAIHCEADGRIWLGCRNGAIMVIEDEKVSVVSVGEPDRGSIEKIVRTRNGIIWIATSQDGVLQFADGELRKDPTPGSPDQGINALVIDPNDRPMIGGDTGIFVLDEGRWILQTLPELDRPVTAIHADEQGVLIGTGNGYLELDRELNVLPPAEHYTGHFPITLPDRRITAILRSHNGELWLGTPSGLAHLSKRGGQPNLRVISEANGLGHDLVSTLHQDRSGSIWCGTGFGGVSRFMSDAFIHFTDRDGLRSRIVSAIHRTPDGILWIATMGGGISSWDGQHIVSYGKEHGLTDPYIITLGEDRLGYLLAGTAAHGVFRWNGQKFMADASLSPAGASVHVIERDAEGNIWVGHDEGSIRITHPDGKIKEFRVPATVLDMEHTADTTWIATGAGLYYLTSPDRGTIKKHPLIPDIPVHSIARDVQHNLWIGTDGSGLWRLNGSRTDSVTMRANSMGNGQTLNSNAVVAVLLDAYQNVWACTRRGIHELELDVMQEMVLSVQHFGAEDGFIGIEAFSNAALLDEDSTLWFGTLRGATRYDPQATRELHDEPMLHLTGMQLFFEDVDWSRWSDSTTHMGVPIGLELPYNKNHLTFNFTGISLAYPERVRYRYILEGHDPEWSPITTTDRVIYSNIPPGEYAFKVMSQNASGVWNEEPLTHPFVIIAPFWQRTWVQALALAFIIFVVLGTIRLREKRSKQTQVRLEGMVQDRTSELAREQERSETLLLNILPRSTAEELKNKGSAETRLYENSTVLFSDFTGFTSMSSQMEGHALVSDLDHFFRLFDRITDRFGIEKIKTIGDAYMCASGIPEPKPTHALDAVLTSTSMILAMQESNAERKQRGMQEWAIRIGMHSGPIVAGVVGEKKFAYDIWGNTVNIASRMESNSHSGRINISGATYAQVMEFVEVQPRGPIKVRGKGELQMYFLLRLKPAFSADQQGLVPNERLLRIREEMLSVMIT